jgi:putative adhesin
MYYRPERRLSRGFRIAASVAFTLAAAACGFPVGPFQARVSDTWTRSYPISKTGEVSVVNVNGRVDVEGVDGTTVEITAEKIARGATDQLASDLLKRVSIVDHATPDSVSVETQKIDGILLGASFEVRYHVKAPRTASVRAVTVNGGVQAKSIDGRLIARTTNGGIVGTAIAGGVEARVVNGGIRIRLASVGKGDVVMTTVNGGVRLALPEAAKATVSASWVNGGMKLSGLKFEVREESRRHFEGLLNGGGTPITLNTVNGGVSITSGAEDVKQEQTDGPPPEKLAE